MNRIFTFLFPVLLLVGHSATAQIGNDLEDHFVTTWNTALGSGTTVTIPINLAYTYNYEVDWDNDGTFDQSGITGNATHNYGTDGTYTIRIRGTFPHFYSNSFGDGQKLISVDQWGDNVWQSMKRTFEGCTNLTGMDTAPPDLSEVNDMHYMFYEATNFNQPIGDWNTANVTNMRYMFYEATSFNQPIGDWNTDNVADMESMFDNAANFNQAIGDWNTANVTDMKFMFYKATNFDQDIGDWNIAQANVTLMLYQAGLSVANYDALLIAWDEAGYTGKNLGNVQGLAYCEATCARQNLVGKGWTIQNDVQNCSNVSLNPDDFVTTWNTALGSGTTVTIPTNPAYSYDYEVDWNNDGIFDECGITGNVTHDYGTDGTYTIRIRGTFPHFYSSYYSDRNKLISVNQWGDNVWQSMESTFEGCANLTGMDTTPPDLSEVTDMSDMFSDAYNFNQPIGDWNTTNVTNMNQMFAFTANFNQPIGNWNTANVTDMSYMFFSATNFNQPIGNWNTTNVTNMSFMFYEATSFNQPISNWNTANVTDMGDMFKLATNFNQPIGNWNTANVTDMSYMFNYATNFDQDISNWNIAQADVIDMLFQAGLSVANYDALLIAWDEAGYTGKILFSVEGLSYCFGKNARQNLTANKGWLFSDDQLDCSGSVLELTCPGNQVVSAEAGTCSAAIDYPDPQTFLNEAAQGIVLVESGAGNFPPSGAFPVGVTELSFTAEYEGLTADCSFTVTVNDEEAPTFAVCSENLVVGNDPGACGALVSGINPLVNENCPGTVVELISPANLGNDDFFPVGTTTVTYRATDASGNSAECSFTVTINDTEDPTITTCPEGRNATLSGDCMVIVPNLIDEAAATDNCSVTLTQTPAAGDAVNAVHNEEVIVTVTATDAAGLTASCEVTLTAKDTEAPTVLTQNVTLTLDNADNLDINPAQIDNGSFDNCGIVSLTLDQTNFDCSQAGDNTVTLTATDAAGNTESATATVTVVQGSGCYCQAGGQSTQYEWIQSVAINGTENDSGNNGGYADFTQQTPFEMTAGASNSLTLTPGFAAGQYHQYWTVFIDLNQDNEFTNDELLYYKKKKKTINTSIFLPAATMTGSTRMRVVMSYNGYQDACATFANGEVEDYTVNITQYVPTYCAVSGQSTQYEWIERVRFADLDHTSGNDGGYGDHTDQTATVHQGSYYLFKGNPGYSGSPEWEYWSAWADWNQDGDFNDYGELLFDRRSKGQLNKWFYVPSWAPSGVTRMRVAMSYYGWAYPCTDFSYGEVEDYTLIVGTTSGATGNDLAVSDGTVQENFTALKAKRSGLRADLSWSTTEGLFTDYFVVERSADGVSFDSIGVETEVHDTYEPMAYAFTDDQPLKGDNYYRLRLMTPRGEATHSEVRQLHFEQSGDWAVFPNPANSYTHVDLQSYAGQSATIRLIDAQGTVRLRQTFDALPEEPVRLNLSKLMDGTYRVWIKVEGQRAQTRTIVVTRLWGETIKE